MLPRHGDTVRLLRAAAGMAPGSEGTMLGWYAGIEPTALVSFWDGGPLRVPVDAIARAEREDASLGGCPGAS